jgi:hypothetical protein
MAVIAGDLVTRLGVDGRKFQSGLAKARGETRSFAADVTKIVSAIALYDIGKSAVTSVFGLARETVNLAATAETAAVQFKVLTGSASSAAAVMDEINKFAADTPFESMEITQAAKQLIAFGGSAGTVIGELRTLGDLSAGMGIPLTELAEIYGKARIQGRLFMEDINQLQGRGINISAELAKEFGNVREAVEKGQVNFGHLERALKAMTSEGGAFAGMMQDMSKTFEGQTSTLLDNIKAIGRDIGEMILPRLTEMVDQSNKVLAAFNALGDARWKFLGDVLVASFDVAIETIKIHWKQMLKDMTKEVSLFSVDVIPGVAAARNAAAGKLMPERAGGGLDAAQNRLNALIGQLNPGQQPPPFQWQGPREQGFAAGILRNMKPKPGEMGPAFQKLFSAIGSDALLGSAKNGIMGIAQRGQMQANAMAGTLSNWFNSPDWEKNKQQQQQTGPTFANAQEKGSQEAFATILNNVLGGKKDPMIKATEKQTQQLVAAFTKQKPTFQPKFAPEFA